MGVMKKIAITSALVLFILTVTANIQAQTNEFAEAVGSGTGELSEFAKWSFSIGADKYEVSNNGRAKRINGKKSVTNFRLPLANNEILSRIVYFARYKNDLILLCESSDGESGGGLIISFNGTTLKQKWQANISGFNVGQGLIENQFAYLTAIGFVAKIDLVTGKYVWKHNNLYKNSAFNSFEIPELDGSNVIFTENKESEQSSPNIIAVNKISGKIVRTVLGQ
jgi:hypothetical protein